MTGPLMFTPLPEGQMSEAVTLPGLLMQLGLQHIEGAGVRVVIWDGCYTRHMAAARARRWAKELEDGDYAETFKPVIEALRKLSDRVEEIEASVAAQKAAA
jgi:hypothetical protein